MPGPGRGIVRHPLRGLGGAAVGDGEGGQQIRYGDAPLGRRVARPNGAFHSDGAGRGAQAPHPSQ